MIRIAARTFLAIALALFVTVLHAAPARAADMCAMYPERLTARDIKRYQYELRRMVPVRDAALAQRFEIVNVPRDGRIGPEVPEPVGGIYRVEMPEGYQRLLCRLAVIFAQIGPKAGPVIDAFKPEFSSCVEQQHFDDPADCLFKLVEEIVTEPRLRTVLKEPTKEAMETLVDGAMIFALLHEFAHVADDHFGGQGGNPETRADTFAVVRSALFNSAQGGNLGALLSQIMLGMLDDLVDPSDEHGRFLCRAESMKAVTFAVEPRIMSILYGPASVLGESDRGEKTPAYYEASLREIFAPPLSDAELRRAGCPPTDRRYIAALNGDLDLVAGVQDRSFAARGEGDSMSFAFYDPLVGLKLRTSEGRAVRATVIAVRFRRIESRLGERGSTITDRDYYEHVERELKRPGFEEIGSQEYAALLAGRGRGRLSEGLSGEFNDPRVLASYRDYQQAVYYWPNDGRSYIALSLMEMLRDDCGRAFKWLDQGLEFAEGPDLWALGRLRKGLELAVAKQGCRKVLPETMVYFDATRARDD